MRKPILMLIAVGCGALFAAGLLIGGMTLPAKIVGFLDVTGAWDPTLLFVMMGAIGVHAPLGYLIRRSQRPLLADEYKDFNRSWSLDKQLLIGAAIFGAGWGLGGYCPGPAIVALSSAVPFALVFVPAMILGMILWQQVHARFINRKPAGGT